MRFADDEHRCLSVSVLMLLFFFCYAIVFFALVYLFFAGLRSSVRVFFNSYYFQGNFCKKVQQGMLLIRYEGGFFIDNFEVRYCGFYTLFVALD